MLISYSSLEMLAKDEPAFCNSLEEKRWGQVLDDADTEFSIGRWLRDTLFSALAFTNPVPILYPKL
jgi:hypothetical protein